MQFSEEKMGEIAQEEGRYWIKSLQLPWSHTIKSNTPYYCN